MRDIQTDNFEFQKLSLLKRSLAQNRPCEKKSKLKQQQRQQRKLLG